MLRNTLLLVVPMLLAACAARDVRQNYLDQGAQPLSSQELVETLVGNTIRVDGAHVYYAPDGRKIVKSGNGLIERRWRRNEQGDFCETLARSGAENCSFQWYVLGEDYLVFDDSGTLKYRMRLLPGNPEQL